MARASLVEPGAAGLQGTVMSAVRINQHESVVGLYRKKL
jgi:hypothetical protein